MLYVLFQDEGDDGDYGDDWGTKAALMSVIYNNATVTLSAHDSKDS
jgi:hypothetical protein